MISAKVQSLVEKALKERIGGKRKIGFSAALDRNDAAQAMVALLVDSLNGCWSTLNTGFQAAVADKDYARADQFKQGMDTISLVTVGLERKVIALYDADSASAAAQLQPIVDRLKSAAQGDAHATTTADQLAQGVSALTSVLGLVS
jgi:uncharacterized protein YidB (DUF937 family)